jgi:hydrogenase expression/formation protein HypE
MRDPTRGGLATVCHDIARSSGLGVRLQEMAIPVDAAVRSVCDILGYDPLYLACEGRVVAVIAATQAHAALQHWRTLPQGQQAAIIGTVTDIRQTVILETALGGERLLQQLEDDPLPRIC